jgi:RimJ/RimL family protein N-acetyltransferase
MPAATPEGRRLPRARQSPGSALEDEGSGQDVNVGSTLRCDRARWPGACRFFVINTPRLILRPWRESDLAPFAALNADPAVMRFFPSLLTATESEAWVSRAVRHLADHRFGPWAVEAPDVAPFIGAVGLLVVGFEADFTPAVEVTWRLGRLHWGRGFATEAARAAIQDGFDRIGIAEVVAFTALANVPSQRVMERLGMTRSGEFDHPRLPAGHALRRHVLFRLPRTARAAGDSPGSQSALDPAP